MIKLKQTSLEKALLCAVMALLLMAPSGQTAMLTDSSQTTSPPQNSTSPSTMQPTNSTLSNSTTHSPCAGKNADFCLHGGSCTFHQDSSRPFCICTETYSGTRCETFVDLSYRPINAEEAIAISLGVVMVIVFAAAFLYLVARRKCVKSAPLIKSAPSETSV